jgi:hypothetical protein
LYAIVRGIRPDSPRIAVYLLDLAAAVIRNAAIATVRLSEQVVVVAIVSTEVIEDRGIVMMGMADDHLLGATIGDSTVLVIRDTVREGDVYHLRAAVVLVRGATAVAVGVRGDMGVVDLLPLSAGDHLPLLRGGDHLPRRLVAVVLRLVGGGVRFPKRGRGNEASRRLSGVLLPVRSETGLGMQTGNVIASGTMTRRRVVEDRHRSLSGEGGSPFVLLLDLGLGLGRQLHMIPVIARGRGAGTDHRPSLLPVAGEIRPRQWIEPGMIPPRRDDVGTARVAVAVAVAVVVGVAVRVPRRGVGIGTGRVPVRRRRDAGRMKPTTA